MSTATDTNGAAGPEEARAARLPLPRPERRVVPPVPILLDRERHLRMDFAAMDAFEEATGTSAWSADAWSQPSPKMVATLIWAALLHEDPELTVDQVRRLPGMEIANMAYLSDRLGELWGVTMPEPEEAPASEGADESDPKAGERGDADPNPPKRRAG